MKQVAVKRALVSVFDKQDIVGLARGLRDAGAEIISTGGTARALTEAGLPVREVADLTGYPEMMDGRVKTLHPRVHGGLLAVRDNAAHLREARAHGIEMIDLVAINLYPFGRTLRDHPDDRERIIEMIDIGGPAMIRSASKNFRDVVVLVDPRDYGPVLEQIRAGGVSPATRVELAARAFAHTAAYDAIISGYLSRQAGTGAGAQLPEVLSLAFERSLQLRYGENPHQTAALYADPLEQAPCAVTATQLQGKELSFNNILDLDAAWGLVCDFKAPACAVIKHTNPAGAALGSDAAEACRSALSADRLSAFGGIVGFNRTVSGEAAREVASLFLEAVIAPDYAPEALEILKPKSGLRLMKTGEVASPAGGWDYKRVVGGLLVQQRDGIDPSESSPRCVTRRAPEAQEIESLVFAWTIARHVKSNAIVFARGVATAAVGAGQMSRVDAVKIGIAKAAGSLRGCVLASDAFFPFRDGVDEAARAGVTAIIQPGGSVKDQEVIAAADEHQMAMVFTGRRHFKH